MADLESFYLLIESQLDDRDYICGEFSLADISVFFTVAFAVTLGVPITSTKLKEWFERALARPTINAEYDEIMRRVADL